MQIVSSSEHHQDCLVSFFLCPNIKLLHVSSYAIPWLRFLLTLRAMISYHLLSKECIIFLRCIFVFAKLNDLTNLPILTFSFATLILSSPIFNFLNLSDLLFQCKEYNGALGWLSSLSSAVHRLVSHLHVSNFLHFKRNGCLHCKIQNFHVSRHWKSPWNHGLESFSSPEVQFSRARTGIWFLRSYCMVLLRVLIRKYLIQWIYLVTSSFFWCIDEAHVWQTIIFGIILNDANHVTSWVFVL